MCEVREEEPLLGSGHMYAVLAKTCTVLKALSIQQPHADEVLLGGKDVENRTWRLPSGMKGQRIYVQTFLLHHPRQSLSIVAPSSVRYHHPSIVRGHHLTYLFVAVTSTNLVHRSLIRFERHQKSRPAVHSPSRVVGVDEWTGTHRTPQLMVGIPHCTPGTSQRVLADRPLAQLHTSQRSEHSGDLPYRNAHSIVEHVGRRHHSSPYPVPRHLGSGNRRNAGCVDNPHSPMLESASTSGAG